MLVGRDETIELVLTSQRSLTVLLNMQSQLYEYADTINKAMVEMGIKTAATLLDRALKEGIPVRLGTNGCISSDSRQSIFTGEAADKEHISELFKILARLLMKNAKDFKALLDDVLSVLQNAEVVIITAYLSKRLCEQADQLGMFGNTVSIFLLDKVFEAGVRSETAELYVMADRKFFESEEGAVGT